MPGRDLAQKANDAVLEAAAWKETAARWRKRALRDRWKLKAKRLEEKLDASEERGAVLAEKVQGLECEVQDVKYPFERQLAMAKQESDQLRLRTEQAERELRDLKKRVGTIGTLEHALVENDALKKDVANMKSLVGNYQRTAEVASAKAYEREKEANDLRRRTIAELVNPAKARIRVIAVRLGIDQAWPGWADDDLITAEVDRRLHELLARCEAGDPSTPYRG